jgi:hypothetical protein
MLTEIEDRLIKLLRETLTELPAENISASKVARKPPAIVLSNLGFKFRNAGLAENIEELPKELEERADCDGIKTSFVLQEKPQKNSVHAESPPGTLLTEKKDFTINYDEGSIQFLKAPKKGKNKIFVRYQSQKRVITLKSLRMKALYSFEVFGEDRAHADSLAEKVVKAILLVEDQLRGEGIELRPLGGAISTEEEKIWKVQLKYTVEKELRVEQVAGPMEKIEITQKQVAPQSAVFNEKE